MKNANANANEREREKGSILVLTLISVLILSLMMIGLLTVGTTELQTTQNYQLNKSAYYAAVQGVEEVRNLIFQDPSTETVELISKSKYMTQAKDTFGTVSLGTSRSYIIGTIRDWEENTPQTVVKFEGFQAPPLPSISLGTGISISPMVWRVNITAESAMGKRTGYSEIVAGIYSTIVTGYN